MDILGMHLEFFWLWIIPVLGVLVIVHEMGHFFTALLFGIKVEEFGIGFPPRAFAVKFKGIDFSLNWLPIGGFVKIVGENGDSDDPRSFGKAPAWQRIIVLAAGSIMNLLLALILFTLLSISGTTEIDGPTTAVVDVMQNKPAMAAGIQPGDKIVSVNGQVVNSSDQIRALSQQYAGQPLQMTVERNGKPVDITVTPEKNPADGAYLGVQLTNWISPATVDAVRPGSVFDKAGLKPGDQIVDINSTTINNLPLASKLIYTGDTPLNITVMRDGQKVGPLALDLTKDKPSETDISFVTPHHTVYYSPSEALGRALSNTWNVIASVPRGLAMAFSGQAQGPAVTGPVGIGQVTGEIAQRSGLNGLLNLTALLGISLFMINMLPLPALDGGRLLFIIIELLRGGRRVSPQKEGLVHFAGMMILLTFLLVITVFDVGRLFSGQSILGP